MATPNHFCSKCGSPVGTESRYCSSCGSPVGRTQEVVDQAPITESPKPETVQNKKRNCFKDGAQTITGRDDLYLRAGLLFDELNMGGNLQSDFKQNLESIFSESELLAWEKESTLSTHAIPLIKRFSAVEGDVRNSGIKGQGRIGTSFPRMGGVLCNAANKAGVSSTRVASAVELTVHAGYLASLLLFEGIPQKPFRKDREIVWRQFIIEAYSVPTKGVEMIWSISAFEEFWQRFLTSEGMDKPAKDFLKKKIYS